MSCGVCCRHGSDLVSLWLWLAAVVQICPLAWELSHAVGAALGEKKKKESKISTSHRTAVRIISYMSDAVLSASHTQMLTIILSVSLFHKREN